MSDYTFCEECGEFECEIDHDEEGFSDDGDWMFNGSGMVGDD